MRAPAPARHRLLPRGPPPEPGAEKRPPSPTHLPSRLDKGSEPLGPARSRACLRRGWGEAGEPHPAENYDSQKAPGTANLRFSAGGSAREGVGGGWGMGVGIGVGM